MWAQKAKQNFEPDLLIYNAGTDILDGDPLGRLLVSRHCFPYLNAWNLRGAILGHTHTHLLHTQVSPDGVKQRDEMVFKFSREKNCPIVMLTSGTLPCQQCYSRFIAGR